MNLSPVIGNSSKAENSSKKEEVLNEILRIKPLYYFIVLCVLSIFCTYFVKDTFVSEKTYFNTFSDRLNEERINTIFATSSSYTFLTYIFLPFLLLIKVGYNTFFVTTATLLESQNGFAFEKTFNICLKAEIVFILMALLRIILFSFFKKVNNLSDLNYIPFSLLNIFNPQEIPKWARYPLGTVNIWELFYCLFGTSLFARLYNIKFVKAAKLFCIPYIAGLTFLFITAAFIIIQFS